MSEEQVLQDEKVVNEVPKLQNANVAPENFDWDSF